MKNNPLLKTKERIILESINIIHEVGIDVFSTREVARRVGISEAAIYKHFKSKSDLMLSILDHFSYYDLDVIQSIHAKNLSPIESIRCFISTYANYYNNYPAITAITQDFDLLQCNELYRDKIKEMITTHIGFITGMLDQAKEVGLIANDVDSEAISLAITGTLREWCLFWRVSNYSFSLKERVLATLDILLKSLCKK